LVGSPVAQEGVTIEIGAAGQGGHTDWNIPETDGEPGVASAVFAFPP